MDLNILWFILITVLFIGFLFLEGFDYGSGAVLPIVAKTDMERRIVINSLGPIWDGNEVWLLTAGGAIFAAFPHWYATMFSGFYLALLVILLALIVRIVAIEFRSKVENSKWRRLWDYAIAIGSALPALLWGVAITNLVTGVPIGADMEYAGSFWNLVAPFDLLGGVLTLFLFSYEGCLFISLKTENEDLKGRCRKCGNCCFGVALLAFLAWFVCALIFSNMYHSALAWIATAVTAGALLFSFFAHLEKRRGWAFLGAAVGIAAFTVAVFAGMFPNVMISTLDAAYSLTIYNASSSPYTLKVMTIVALTMVPIVLAYQIWTYWVFRKRVTEKDLEY